jgi:hypothetical protein
MKVQNLFEISLIDPSVIIYGPNTRPYAAQTLGCSIYISMKGFIVAKCEVTKHNRINP